MTTARGLQGLPLLLLAGGYSARMGAPKGLLAFRGRPWILEQLGRFRAARGCDVVVVLGAEAEQYLAQVPELGREPSLLCVVNPRPERGQFSSFRLGAERVLASPAVGAFVLPVDVPAASPEVWWALAEVLDAPGPGAPSGATPARGGLLAAIPTLDDDRGGHPLLLSRPALERILGVDPRGERARLDLQLAELPSGALVRVRVSDPRVRMNLNTPEEWEAFANAVR